MKTPLILTMAYRNLLRHPRRTIIMISTIAFGLAVILWLQCILAGRNKNMIDTVVSSRTGHLQIYTPKYFKQHLIQDSFNDDLSPLRAIVPAGSALSRRIHLPAIIASGDQSATVLLEGIEPQAEEKITNIANQVMPGKGSFLEAEPFADCPSRQIYIGKEMAEMLEVGIGGRIAVMTQAADGSLGNDLFLVKGIYDAKSADVEKTWAYTPLLCAQKIGALKGVHEVVIRLSDDTGTAEIKEKISEAYPKLKITTWREALPSLSTMLQVNDATMVMISILLFVVISLGIVNTFLIGIFERTREFGVMLALGTTPGQLMKIIVCESLCIGVCASFLGMLIGTLGVLYHQHAGFDLSPFLGKHTSVDQFSLDLIIYPIFHFAPFVKPVIFTLILVTLTGLYPAYRASRFQPIEAIRS